MIDHTHEALRNVELSRGAGHLWDNLQNVLDALWTIAENGVVHRQAFEPHLLRLRKHFVELERLGCVSLLVLKERGTPLARITLLKRNVSEFRERQQDAKAIIKKTCAEESQPVLSRPPVEELPICLMFIDVPNVCHFKLPEETGTGFQPAYLSFFRADWLKLRQLVCEMTHVPMDRQHCFMYVRSVGEQVDRCESHCARLAELGLRVTKRPKKDVDCLLITDMIMEILPYVEKKRHVHLVLMSGDGDYAYALKRIRQLANTVGTRVTMRVIAWEHAHSRELAHAVYPNLHFIEPLLTKLDPMGATLLMQDRQRREAAG